MDYIHIMSVSEIYLKELRTKLWYKNKRRTVVIFILGFLSYYTLNVMWDKSLTSLKTEGEPWIEWNKARKMLMDTKDRDHVIQYKENKLLKALKKQKGLGCHIPHLDPYDPVATRFDMKYKKVKCNGTDWVKCYYSECKVKEEILNTSVDVVCRYTDIVYDHDKKYYLKPAAEVYYDGVYTLTASDHVRVNCTRKSLVKSYWGGIATGFRNTVKQFEPPSENTINVLILGFDSASRIAFIRRMPKTYKYLQEMGATILTGYNIVGDGTPAAFFPLLSGKTELEFPDVRKFLHNKNTLDVDEFIFSKVGKKGYRTAYFEDMPTMGTFQWRFNGFNSQPADHYLRPFFLEDYRVGFKTYCVGDTPRYRLMMNLTQQFLSMDCKRFIFTFIADISHNNYNQITTADEDAVAFLKAFNETGKSKDTLLVVMGDHGPRFSSIRKTLIGRLEERLPFMAIRLPDLLVSRRPEAVTALKKNSGVLTTPHDIHATILDVLDMREHWNRYKIAGADLTRALTLLEPIPKSRSCSEAGIEAHWCSCLSWKRVDQDDPMYQRVADALVTFINQLTEPVRHKCALRPLTSISWVMKLEANEELLFFKGSDKSGFIEQFGPKAEVTMQTYQAKVTLGPGEGIFEGTMTYTKKGDKFALDIRHISRINMYNREPECIQTTHVHLEKICYCH